MNTGIYCIRNLFDGKEYVGSAARSFKKRWQLHIHHLKRHIHDNWLLQAAWDACGESAFEFNVVEECPPEQCIEREQWWINDTNPAYNICRIAGSCLGRRHSEETREKCRISKLGNKYCVGRKDTLEHRASMIGNKFGVGTRISVENISKKTIDIVYPRGKE